VSTKSLIEGKGGLVGKFGRTGSKNQETAGLTQVDVSERRGC